MKRKTLALILAFSIGFTNLYFINSNAEEENQITKETTGEDTQTLPVIQLKTLENKVSEDEELKKMKDELSGIIENLNISDDEKENLKTLVEVSKNKEMIVALNGFFEKFSKLNLLTNQLNKASNPKEMKEILEKIENISEELKKEFANLSATLKEEQNSAEISKALQNAVSNVQEKLEQKQNEIRMIQETVKTATIKAMTEAKSQIKDQIEQKQYEAKRQVEDKIEEAQKNANEKMTDAQKQIREEVKKQVTEILQDAEKKMKEEVKKQVTNQLEEAKKQISVELLNFKDKSQKEIEEKISGIIQNLTGKKIPPSKKGIYKDVYKNLWYANAVEYVTKNRLMTGYLDGSFKPDAIITKAMTLQILYNIEGQPKEEIKNIYSDVKKSDWYFDAVMWADKNSISKGKDGIFEPEKQISREEMAEILYNYARSKNSKADISENKNIKFDDVKNISPKSYEAVKWAFSNGIISGTGKNTVNPKSKVNRAQMAVILKNIRENNKIS